MSCNGMAFFPANFMFQISQNQEDEHESCNQQQPPLYPSQNFIGGKRSVPLSGMMEHRNGCGDKNDCHDAEDDLSDDGSLPGDQKKKRLNVEQVKTLEKSFEIGNKLEPERKVQLARVLGLQPRQIAIWFQNRRARWKTKQLEKDYDALKRQFDAVKAHNEALQAQNQNLQSQIFALTNGKEGAATTTNVVATELFNLNKETIDQDSCSNRSENENSSEQINNMVKLDMSRAGGGGGASDSPGQIPTSMPLFPTSSSTTAKSLRLTSSSNLPATQLFFQHNQLHNNVKEDNFSNMFCGIEEHSGFWPWLEQQQHFN